MKPCIAPEREDGGPRPDTDDRDELTEAIRDSIDHTFMNPSPTRGDLTVTLQGELGTILDWIDRAGRPGYKPKLDIC